MGNQEKSNNLTEILNCAHLGESLCKNDIKSMEQLIETEVQSFKQQYSSLLGKLEKIEAVARHGLSHGKSAEYAPISQVVKETKPKLQGQRVKK